MCSLLSFELGEFDVSIPSSQICVVNFAEALSKLNAQLWKLLVLPNKLTPLLNYLINLALELVTSCVLCRACNFIVRHGDCEATFVLEREWNVWYSREESLGVD